MKKSAVLSLTVYSLLHFAVDFTCATVMFAKVLPHGELWAVAMLLYNYFAFAMQLPFGIIADKLNKNSLVAGLGCALVAMGCFFSAFPLAAAVLCGIGNGLFHVGGGLDALNGRGGKCAPAGIFVSPGALGLWLGTRLGSAGVFTLIPGILLLLWGVALPILFRGSFSGGENAPISLPRAKSTAWVGAAFLLLVVILRGFAGLVFSFEWKAAYALPLILAVVLGKTAGGFAADIFGTKKTAAVSLLASSVLFMLSANPICGIGAVFLFNMTMPLTLTGAADAFPGAKGASFGLMTFGLFCGFLPVYVGVATSSAFVYALMAGLSLGLIIPGLVFCERAAEK